MRLQTIALFFLFCIFALAESKSCGEQISEFLVCIGSRRKEQLATAPKPIPFDQFQNDLAKCFTLHGCKAITLEAEFDIEKRHNAPPGVLYNEKIDACLVKATNFARPNVEKCVAVNLTGFTFPPPLPPIERGVRRPITISWAAQTLLHLRDPVMCPPGASTGEAEECLDGVFKKVDAAEQPLDPFKNFLETEKQVQNLCKADCFSKIGPECNHTLIESFPLICECVSKDFGINKDKYDTALRECFGVDVAKAADYKTGVTVQIVRSKLETEFCDNFTENPCKYKSYVDLLKARKANGGPAA